MTTQDAKNLTNAIQDIIAVKQNTILVKSKQAAEEFSELYLIAYNGEKGSMTGPFYPDNHYQVEI